MEYETQLAQKKDKQAKTYFEPQTQSGRRENGAQRLLRLL